MGIAIFLFLLVVFFTAAFFLRNENFSFTIQWGGALLASFFALGLVGLGKIWYDKATTSPELSPERIEQIASQAAAERNAEMRRARDQARKETLARLEADRERTRRSLEEENRRRTDEGLTPHSARKWHEGGNLQKSTFAQWRAATHANKLATAGDWVATTHKELKLGLDTSSKEAFELSAFYWAIGLVACLDEMAKSNGIIHEKVTFGVGLCLNGIKNSPNRVGR